MNNRQWIQQKRKRSLQPSCDRQSSRQSGHSTDRGNRGFTDHFCPACDLRHLEICDHCPNGDAALWWLRQIREERTA